MLQVKMFGRPDKQLLKVKAAAKVSMFYWVVEDLVPNFCAGTALESCCNALIDFDKYLKGLSDVPSGEECDTGRDGSATLGPSRGRHNPLQAGTSPLLAYGVKVALVR